MESKMTVEEARKIIDEKFARIETIINSNIGHSFLVSREVVGDEFEEVLKAAYPNEDLVKVWTMLCERYPEMYNDLPTKYFMGEKPVAYSILDKIQEAVVEQIKNCENFEDMKVQDRYYKLTELVKEKNVREKRNVYLIKLNSVEYKKEEKIKDIEKAFAKSKISDKEFFDDMDHYDRYYK